MNRSNITFAEIEKKPKTSVYSVDSVSSGERLGIVKWYGPWRKYCFLPEDETLWDHSCLESVKIFMINLMNARGRSNEHISE